MADGMHTHHGTGAAAPAAGRRRVDAGSPALWSAVARSELAVVHLDRDLVVQAWSPGAAALLGWPAREAVGRSWSELGLSGDPVRARQFALLGSRVLAGESWSGERTWCARNGDPVAIRATAEPVLDDSGVVEGIVLLALDVSGREAYERALVREAMRDPLTGLPNRKQLLDRLERLVQGEETLAGTTAVVFVDLDGFKSVNDEHGHSVGDAVLRAVADRLRTTVRDADMVGRLGGDEFVVLCSIPDARGIRGLRHRIVAAIEAPISIGGRDLSVQASVGVAKVEHGAHADVVLDLADADMYREKASGPHR
jgi:diguanylate cyclase (GGDEF)-like protein/PAS domain S-box-containing protein